jgi:hypothetical protein
MRRMLTESERKKTAAKPHTDGHSQPASQPARYTDAAEGLRQRQRCDAGCC